MKKVTFLFLFLANSLSFGQYEMEKYDILKNGKIKTTHINYADKYSEPDYQQFKKISAIRNIKEVKGEVHSMEIYCEKSSTLRYSREFVARGNKNDDGTLDDVFGYYSERADMWAVPFEGSIYIINASIRNITSSKDLVIPFVLGEEIADKVDLFNFYKAIYADYSGGKFDREQKESREKRLEKQLTEERKLDLFSIERNEIKSIKVIHEFYPDFSEGKRTLKIGIEALLDNGNRVKSRVFDGVAIDSEYLFEIEGALPFDGSTDMKSSGHFKVYACSEESSSWSDIISVKVKRKSTGDLLVEDVITLDYNYSLYLNQSGANSSRGYVGSDGATITVDVEQIQHSETLKPLILYTVRSDFGYRQTVTYVKLNPSSELKITYHGGKGGNGNKRGFAGGKKGSLTVNVSPNVSKYNLVHFGSDGQGGNADYLGETENNNSTYTSNEITIKNNTGKSVCIAHYGGSTVINSGSSEAFSCRDLFYGVMDGVNCTGKKGAKIANEDDDCGRTIVLD